MKRTHLSSIAVLLSAFCVQTAAGQAPVKTIEDGVLDKIQLFVASPGPKDTLTVVIKPFAASAADLGTGGTDGKDARQQEAKTMQNEGPRVLAEHFVTALGKSGAVKSVRAVASSDAVPDGALVVEGSFVTLDLGSRAKRYFAGFGAGKSSVKVTGTVKDAGGRTLAIFEQRRVGTMGMGGGDSLGKLMTDSGNIGEDIAKFLARWVRGEKLD